MIQRQDLKLDNWCYGSVRQNEPMQIKSLDQTICKLGEYLEDYGFVRGIPLTPEILSKVGCKEMDNGYWLPVTNLKGELHFETFKSTDEIVSTLHAPFCELILDRIYFLHQLQNIFYWFTKTELPYTP